MMFNRLLKIKELVFKGLKEEEFLILLKGVIYG